MMKPSIIAAIVASFIAMALAARKQERLAVVALLDNDKRYDIDELIADDEL